MSVVAAGDDALLLGVHGDHIDGPGVRKDVDVSLRPLVLLHQLDLHEDALPEQQPAVLGACHLLPVRELYEADDVRQLGGSELADVALQLQPGEGRRHLPEADVASACRGQHARELAPANVVDVLTVGLALQQQPLVSPVPNAEEVVGRHAEARDVVLVVRGELTRGIPTLGALAQDAVEPERGRLGLEAVDVYVRLPGRALLSHREIVHVGRH
mmetsp:Transcript_96307/g.249102  ORF Transcript_96307/g.249102 Transcript_96307/m.249102 type:complete len:214 (-) Transcript_96307:259-900(-)